MVVNLVVNLTEIVVKRKWPATCQSANSPMDGISSPRELRIKKVSYCTEIFRAPNLLAMVVTTGSIVTIEIGKSKISLFSDFIVYQRVTSDQNLCDTRNNNYSGHSK